VSGRFLLDNSAWARLGATAVPHERKAEVAGWVETERLVASVPFLLEAGYSARDAREHDTVLDELLALPFVQVDDAVERRSLHAQSQLARTGHHRLPPVDLLVAALADVHQLGVLHYDHDYDLIAQRTDLRFDSEWLVPRGAI
jgi:predicted nucleic acid-binding protein